MKRKAVAVAKKAKTTAIAAAALAAFTTAPVATAEPDSTASNGATAHAGERFFIETSARPIGCTINSFIIVDGEASLLTAGHCIKAAKNEGTPLQVKTVSGQALAGKEELGRATYQVNRPGLLFDRTNGLQDVATLPLAEGVDVDYTTLKSSFTPSLGSSEILRGFFSGEPVGLGEPRRVTANLTGTMVCKDGSTTARTCGPIVYANEQTQDVVALIPSFPGDSGGPLTILGEDGKRHVIGTGSLSLGLISIYDNR
ncbi:MAG TPA: S1 family peptidase [Candidatus Corynebacterium gallistercoris]|uniref:S1 family peptidase n=1 Tax=Candidatus Corynebacterium gallistercoris TaxID=2838530 RepID=A0A9D1RZF1_9CORY|nr:S1 family peptidase [Candidatus Corynebacterium gallistercoris]